MHNPFGQKQAWELGEGHERIDLAMPMGGKAPNNDPNGWPASRVGDTANVPMDSHGCPACPHNCTGPGVVGSHNVFINGKPAMRTRDTGTHAACCGPNQFVARFGSANVKINKRLAVRKGDQTEHCGGNGKMMSGSPSVRLGGPSVRDNG